MHTFSRSHLITLAKIVTLGLLLGLGIQFLFAWTAPSGAAPTGNVAGPLSAGPSATYQYRVGGLGLGETLKLIGIPGQEIAVTAPKFCINNAGDASDATGNCISDWPTGGSGGVAVDSGVLAPSDLVPEGNGYYCKTVTFVQPFSSVPKIIVSITDNGTGGIPSDRALAYYQNVTPSQVKVCGGSSSNNSNLFNIIPTLQWMAVAANAVGGGSTPSMITGWPDAIKCESGVNTQLFYISTLQPNVGANGQVRYADPYTHSGSGAGAYCFDFDKNGNWLGTCGGAAGMGMAGCVGKSIANLDALGWTFNFGGGGGAGDNLGNQIADATHGLNMSNTTIFNLKDPQGDQDAATKGYVDGKVGVNTMVVGGYYKHINSNQCNIVNPITGGCSCPGGYTAWLTGTANNDSRFYLCLK
jgi:hypothetical protein